jgi:hypothetical protein
MSLLNLVLAVRRVEAAIDALPEGDTKVTLLASLLQEPDLSGFELVLNGQPIPCDPENIIEVYFMVLARLKNTDILTIVDNGEILDSSDRMLESLQMYKAVYRG